MTADTFRHGRVNKLVEKRTLFTLIVGGIPLGIYPGNCMADVMSRGA